MFGDVLLGRDLVAQLEARVRPEVGQVLSLLLGQVVVVRHPALDHGLPPGPAARFGPPHLPDGRSDVVVVLDRVLDLVVDPLGVR